jgi:hypothetical protein
MLHLNKDVILAYIIISVTSPRPHQCAGQAAMAVTQTATGMWLTSGVVQRGGPGSCSLRLEALPGQRLNVTLWDFSGLVQHRSSAAIVSSSSADACRSYGKIGEPGHTHSPVCSGTERIKHVFMSQGHVVDLEYKHLSDDTDARSLLHVRGLFNIFVFTCIAACCLSLGELLLLNL